MTKPNKTAKEKCKHEYILLGHNKDKKLYVMLQCEKCGVVKRKNVSVKTLMEHQFGI